MSLSRDTYILATPYQTICPVSQLPEDGAMTSAILPSIIPAASPTAWQYNSPAAIPGSGIPASLPSKPTSSSTALVHTQNGHCATNGATCLGWPLGQCCSQYNSCGSSSDYCVSGCQSEFGLCGTNSSSPSPSPPNPSSTSTASLPASTAVIPTTNGFCAMNGATCLGWPLGQCCSVYNSCGSSADYCGAGCQSAFGLCGLSSSSPALAPVPSSTIALTPSPSPTCPGVALADFYWNSNQGGQVYHACGTYGVCQNAPAWFQNEAS